MFNLNFTICHFQKIISKIVFSKNGTDTKTLDAGVQIADSYAAFQGDKDINHVLSVDPHYPVINNAVYNARFNLGTNVSNSHIYYGWRAGDYDILGNFDHILKSAKVVFTVPDDFQIQNNSFTFTDDSGHSVTVDVPLSQLNDSYYVNYHWLLNVPDSKFTNGSAHISLDGTNAIKADVVSTTSNTKVPAHTDSIAVAGPLNVIKDLSDYHGQLLKINQMYGMAYIGENNTSIFPSGTKNYDGHSYESLKPHGLFHGAGEGDFLTVNGNVSLTNASVTYNVPDGFLITTQLVVNNYDSATKLVVKFRDGTTKEYSNLNSGYITLENQSGVKSVTFSNFTNPHSIPYFNWNKHYQIQNVYTEGSLRNHDVQPNDLLKVTGSLTSDQITSGNLDFGNILVIDRDKVPAGATLQVITNETDKKPGVTGNSIEITVSSLDGAHIINLKNPTFYAELNYLMQPELSNVTVTWQHGDKTETLNPDVSVINENGHRYLKIHIPKHLSALEAGAKLTIKAGIQNTSDAVNATEGYLVYLVSDDSSTALYQEFQNEMESAPVDEVTIEGKTTDVGRIPGEWEIISGKTTGSFTLQKGNLDSNPSAKATSNDRGSEDMTLFGSVITPDKNLQNFSEIINVPTTADGKSEFNPELTGPAQVVDIRTGRAVANATVKYSESLGELNPTSLPDLSGYTKTAGQVTDWSKIKSILVTMPSVAKGAAIRVVMPAKDHNLRNDANKTIYMSSATYAEGLTEPYIIKPGKAGSAALTVVGKSTIKTIIRYQDDNGTTQDVVLDDQAKTYEDGKDTMKRGDFLSSDSGLTSHDNSLLPANLKIDYDHPTIQSNKDRWDKTVQYDFDGDAVIFNAVLQHPTSGKVTYEDIDKNNQQIASSGTLEGNSGDAVNYSTADEIRTLEQQGYVLVDNEFDPTGTAPKFKNDPTDNNYVVKLRHQVQEITKDTTNVPSWSPVKPTDLSKNVKLTVSYINSDHTTFPETLKPSNAEQSLSFSGKGYIDLVDQKQVNAKRDVNGNWILDKDNTATPTITWTPDNGTFTKVVSPAEAGYHVDSVSTHADGHDVAEIPVTHDTHDVNVTVKYVADVQTAQLKFIDDDNNNAVLNSVNGQGESNTGISFDNGAQDLQNYLDQGYEFVQAIDNTDPANHRTLATDPQTKYNDIQFGKYDTDGAKTQIFEIHLKHHLVPVTDQDHITTDKQVHRTFTFQYDVPNTVTPPAVPTLNPQDLHFKGTGVIDKVTNKLATTDEHGKITNEYDLTDDHGLTWKLDGGTADNGTFVAPTMPTIPAGYHVESIKSTTVATPTDGDWTTETGTTIAAKDGIKHNSPDIQVLVTLAPDPQTANLNFVDDTTGSTLADWDSTTGVSDESPIAFAHGDHILQHYLDNGYKFVNVTNDTAHVSLDGDDYASAAQNFGKFDHDTKNDQNFTVHLVHDTITVTPENPGNPGQPINHDPNGAKYPTGTDAQSLQHNVNRTIHYVYDNGLTAKPDHADQLHFVETKVIDRVTGKVISDAWDGPYDFAEIASPVIPGYTADKANVVNKGIGHDHDNIVEKVTYTPDAQKLTVTYIDDTTGQVLKTVTKDGHSDQSANYNTGADIRDFESQHYRLVSDSTNGQDLVFDHDDDVDQSYIVHLTHQTEPASHTKVIVRTINYIDGQTGQHLKPSVTQLVTFHQTGTKDLVTGDISWDPSAPQTFTSVTSPRISGYNDPNIPVVGDQTVTINDSDIVVDVTYTKPAPTVPDNPTTPTSPSAPSNPTTPTSPSTPSNPTTPTSPSTPSNPTTPTSPSTPSNPTTPTSPSTPSNPTTPTSPSTPSNPTTPMSPSTPSNPTTPTSPSAPSNPTTPTSPSTPSNSTTPTSPSTPSNPTTPTSPSAPSTPIESAKPKHPTAPVQTGRDKATTLPQTGNRSSALGLLGLLTIGMAGFISRRKKKN